jgi:Flp pilus assembly protein TadG
MKMRRRQTGAESSRQQGATMLTVVVALIALLAGASLAVDIGLLLASRTQLQNAVDASALAGAANLIDTTDPSNVLVTAAAAKTAALDQASQNETASTSSVVVLNQDVVIGGWDLDTRTFDSGVNLADPEAVTAVQVTARLDGAANTAVPALLSRVLGRDTFTVSSEATAYVGWAANDGKAELPIAIDCCKLKGAACESDYCETVTTDPPNPCSLNDPQSEGPNTVSCLQWSNTDEQTACWTVFDGDSSSVNANAANSIVENGTTFEVNVGEKFYMDSGDKVSVMMEIADRFYGEGSHAGSGAGTDHYEPIHDPPQADSWIIKLPVIECQTDDHCSGGDPAKLVGFVCFEIREVESTPDKVIRGQFLCENDPRTADCLETGTGTGGLPLGLRAEIPVLVR